MPRESDRFREYVDDLENRKWRCTFCKEKFAGSTPRIRAHLAGIPGRGIKACKEVKDAVRAEALETFNGKGSGLDKSMGGTSGEGTERAIFGESQSVLPSDDASNPNDTQNSNRPGCVLQQPSCNWGTGTGTASACPQDQVSLPPGDMPLDNLDNTQQSDPSNHRLDASHGNEIASPIQQPPMDWSALSPSDLSELLASPKLPTHLGFRGDVLPTPLLSNIITSSIPQFSNGQYPSFDEKFADGITPHSPLYSDWSNLHLSPPKNLLESRGVIANASEEIETDELHNPTVGSSLQTDPFLDVDRANRLQDCGQPRGVEMVPMPAGTSPTDPVQHPGRLPPRCDKEDGNDIHRFLSLTPMDIDPSTASQQLEASTNTIGPSSAHGVWINLHLSYGSIISRLFC